MATETPVKCQDCITCASDFQSWCQVIHKTPGAHPLCKLCKHCVTMHKSSSVGRWYEQRETTHMRFDQNPQLKRELLERLRSKYLTEKPMPHLIEVLYCLTRSYFDRRDPLPPTDQELLYFAVGFGLEEVLLRDEDSEAPGSEQRNGVWLTPDYVALHGGELDLKSTRMSATPTGVPKTGWPETWIEQFKSYAYHMALKNGWEWCLYQIPGTEGQNYHNPNYWPCPCEGTGKLPAELPETVQYSVGIVYLIQPALDAGTFTFTKQELLENWERVRGRLAVYMLHHSLNNPPEPFRWNKDWECRNCRYLVRCHSRGVKLLY